MTKAPPTPKESSDGIGINFFGNSNWYEFQERLANLAFCR